MTHEERRVWLIRYLLDEDADLQAYGVPEEEEEQKRMLRALMNIRPPRPLQGEFLQVQDAYLQEENR
ncbi:MAG: protein-ADP-ribose hydrolase, partial [Clostridia bacterium]|nr:protein-ADP-ribose hydrolase [Clostridia bacterium]